MGTNHFMGTYPWAVQPWSLNLHKENQPWIFISPLAISPTFLHNLYRLYTSQKGQRRKLQRPELSLCLYSLNG